MEKNWEITAFSWTKGAERIILQKINQGNWKYTNKQGALEGFFRGPCAYADFNEYAKVYSEHLPKIHSIKRISDGMEFTVGSNLYYQTGVYPILELVLIEDYIRINGKGGRLVDTRDSLFQESELTAGKPIQIEYSTIDW